MWGMEQKLWLRKQMNSGQQPLWIINGSQIFGKYGPSESLEKDFPLHFERFLRMIRVTHRKIKFVSGDIHASEVQVLSAAEPSENCWF